MPQHLRRIDDAGKGVFHLKKIAVKLSPGNKKFPSTSIWCATKTFEVNWGRKQKKKHSEEQEEEEDQQLQVLHAWATNMKRDRATQSTSDSGGEK